jgi:predicted phosphoribosyltransferase
VAYEIAQRIGAPLDVLVVRKLGVPGHEELAFGALAEGGCRIVKADMLEGLNLSEAAVDEVIAREAIELERRRDTYRAGRAVPDLEGKVVIIVDDGLATGATMEAAVKAVDARHPKEIVVAAPVAPYEACLDFGKARNVSCVCARNPEPFYSVGLYYTDFSETPDSIVTELLRLSREPRPDTVAAQGGAS